MPLTPEDVNKKTFTPVRLREGYDMGEVDQFLDEVETALTQLQEENDDLRQKLSAATAAPPQQAGQAEPAKEPVREEVVPSPLPAVSTVPEASSAAARLLEIAAQNADQLVNEAKDEADKILGEARSKSERLEADSKSKADRLESDAQTRAEKLDSETSERRAQLFGQLERDKDNLARELEDLRAFEREYRSRLKGYFQAQLRALDGEGDGEVPLTPSAEGETPRRLRELLGEEQQD
ncbi:MAG TPA: DivIVA domain-containing protein [Nocardioidaceae bacterium]|jgi:DivIVA domain-containing protein